MRGLMSDCHITRQQQIQSTMVYIFATKVRVILSSTYYQWKSIQEHCEDTVHKMNHLEYQTVQLVSLSSKVIPDNCHKWQTDEQSCFGNNRVIRQEEFSYKHHDCQRTGQETSERCKYEPERCICQLSRIGSKYSLFNLK